MEVETAAANEGGNTQKNEISDQVGPDTAVIALFHKRAPVVAVIIVQHEHEATHEQKAHPCEVKNEADRFHGVVGQCRCGSH